MVDPADAIGKARQAVTQRADLPGGDWPTLLATLEMLARRFPPETAIYPGHGPETTLAAELRSNPFLTALRTK